MRLIRRHLLEISDPPSLLYVRGNPCAAAESAGLPSSAAATRRRRACRPPRTFAKALAGKGARHHQRPRPWHRRRRPSRRTGRRRRNHRCHRHRCRPRLSGAQSRNLQLAIAERGAIVSEFPAGHAGDRRQLSRAATASFQALSCGVLVVEAAPESGSLITARLAAEQGREVFRHSRVDSFAGCPRLPQVDQAGSQTGRNGAGHSRRTRQLCRKLRISASMKPSRQPATMIFSRRTRPRPLRAGRSGRAHRTERRPVARRTADAGTRRPDRHPARQPLPASRLRPPYIETACQAAHRALIMPRQPNRQNP